MLEEAGENVLAELLVIGNCYPLARSAEVLQCFFLQGVGWVGGRRWRKRVRRRTQERVAVERPVDELVGLGVRDHTASVSGAPISMFLGSGIQQNAFLHSILIPVSERIWAPQPAGNAQRPTYSRISLKPSPSFHIHIRSPPAPQSSPHSFYYCVSPLLATPPVICLG